MKRFNNRFPWHVGLISGSVKKVRDIHGKIIQEFVPSKLNKYPTLHTLFERNQNLSQQEVLEREGLINPPVKIDNSVFSKSRSEKRHLKHLKKLHNTSMKKAGLSPKAQLNISDPMVLRRG